MSLVHSVHNNGQVPWEGGRSALGDDGLDGDDTYRLGKHDGDDEKHHHFHHEHPSIISTVGPATDTVPAPRFSTSAALHASSDQSTPSQSQSSASASSIFTPLSAFPSSPSRAYAAADTKADTDADVDEDKPRDGVAGSAVDTVSPSPVPRTTHTQHSASKAKDDAGYDADDGNVSANASGIESLSSHALSLDQTRLRVAYLVSTMVQLPAAAAVSEGGDDRIFWASLLKERPNTTSQESVALASLGQRQSHQCRSSIRADEVTGSARFVHRPGLAIGARRAIPPVYRLQDLVRWFRAACPRVWETADPVKKRQKIFTIAMWQTEVAMESVFTYCSCPAGEGVLLQKSIEKIVKEEQTDRRSNESAKDVPAVVEQPQPALEQADSAGGNANSEDDTAAGLIKCCAQCRHPLPPQRPVVWVRDDVGWSVRAQEAASDTIRRAFRGLRNLWPKKNKRPGLTANFFTADLLHHPRNVPDGLREYKDSSAVAALVAPGSREPGSRDGPAREQEQPSKKTKQGGTGPTSPWDHWDQRNCTDLLAENPANAGVYFPRTAMYRTLDDPEEAEVSSSTSDEYGTAEARARRRKRKTEQRLRRAQWLLKRSVEPPSPLKKLTFAAGAISVSEMGELELVGPFEE